MPRATKAPAPLTQLIVEDLVPLARCGVAAIEAKALTVIVKLILLSYPRAELLAALRPQPEILAALRPRLDGMVTDAKRLLDECERSNPRG